MKTTQSCVNIKTKDKNKTTDLCRHLALLTPEES